MCGIAGFAGLDAPGLVERMTAALAHRGPDGAGHHVEPGLALGCRRLAIVDAAGGTQPLVNETGDVVAVVNGEIYGHRSLRARLEDRGHRFRSRTDVEVIVHAYEEWGEGFVDRLDGDFAIALWDRRTRRLLLARDRFGVHPLYVHQAGRALLFASELKALTAWPELPRELDLERVDRYLSLRYVPGGRTLLRGIAKLGPGELLVWSGGAVSRRRWWTLEPAPPPAGLGAAAERIRELLEESVQRRLEADVPVGLFLSGGVDSAALLALAARRPEGPPPTFSIGFDSAAGTGAGDGTGGDELDAARRLAERFGSEHAEARVGPDDYELLPRIVWHLDEPVGDAIVVPTFRLAETASRTVRVALSGEGADEIFGGYVHHLALHGAGRLRSAVPAPALRALGAAVGRLPAPIADRLFPYPASLGDDGRRVVARYLGGLGAGGGDLAAEYLALGSVFQPEDKAALYGGELAAAAAPGAPAEMAALDGERPRLERLMRYDVGHWLPDYNLLKQDKLGLAFGLEVRVPYLDHRLVELAAGLPPAWKIRGTTTKRALRRAVAGLLPAGTARAPKRAFHLPWTRVFGTGFDAWARELVGGARARSRGLFAAGEPERRLARARQGSLIAEKQTMALVVLELWLRAFADGEGLAAAGRERACA